MVTLMKCFSHHELAVIYLLKLRTSYKYIKLRGTTQSSDSFQSDQSYVGAALDFLYRFHFPFSLLHWLSWVFLWCIREILNLRYPLESAKIERCDKEMR